MALSTTPEAIETLFLSSTLFRLITPRFLVSWSRLTCTDGDKLAVRRLKGFRFIVGLLLVLLIGPISADDAVALH